MQAGEAAKKAKARQRAVIVKYVGIVVVISLVYFGWALLFAKESVFTLWGIVNLGAVLAVYAVTIFFRYGSAGAFVPYCSRAIFCYRVIVHTGNDVSNDTATDLFGLAALVQLLLLW